MGSNDRITKWRLCWQSRREEGIVVVNCVDAVCSQWWLRVNEGTVMYQRERMDEREVNSYAVGRSEGLRCQRELTEVTTRVYEEWLLSDWKAVTMKRGSQPMQKGGCHVPLIGHRLETWNNAQCVMPDGYDCLVASILKLIHSNLVLNSI